MVFMGGGHGSVWSAYIALTGFPDIALPDDGTFTNGGILAGTRGREGAWQYASRFQRPLALNHLFPRRPAHHFTGWREPV